MSLAIPSLEAVQAERAKRSLHRFVQAAWSIVEPDTPYRDNWHIKAICDHLEAVTRGEITRLLINIPPGCSKSLIVSVFWPAWEWATAPGLRYLTGSYTQELSIRDSLKVRDIVTSDWYQRCFDVEFRGDQNQKIKMDTTAGGWRIATSVGGRATGEHPDRIIIDDPHNPRQAESDVQRKEALTWFDRTLSTRGVSRGARMVVIMQRLHDSDLSGHILARNDNSAWLHDWVHLCLPMRYEEGRQKKTPLGWTDPRTTPGELLWPALFPEEVLRPVEASLGTYGAAGQMQQRPQPLEGGLFKQSYFRYFTETEDAYVLTGPDGVKRIPKDRVIRFGTVDLAISTRASADYTVIGIWAQTKDADLLLLDVVRERIQGPEQLDLLEQTNRKWNLAYLAVESVAFQASVVQHLLRRGLPARELTADSDKVTRALGLAARMQGGTVWTKAGAHYLDAWEHELLHFPTGDHDDQVDVGGYAAAALMGGREPRIRML